MYNHKYTNNGIFLMKPISFTGNSLKDLKKFPEGAKREVGYQLDRVQRGLNPNDWKPMKTVGKSVREIRITDTQGIYRVIYIAKFKEAIYVLHAFNKTTQRTAQVDLDIAQDRLSLIIEEHRNDKKI